MILASLAVVSAVMFAGQAQPAMKSGDPVAGKILFEGKGACVTCHSLDDPARRIGPDLSWIGILRTPAALRESLIDPDAQVFRKYFTVVADTNAGQHIEGLAQSEDDRSIQIRDRRGHVLSFLKSDLRGLTREERSLMPSYASRFSAAELDDVVAYLRTLRAMWPVEAGERERPIGGVSENVAFFDRPGRDAEEQPDAIVDALEIPKGATVADLGAGTGYFTWRLAQAVGPTGKVLAVDIQQAMLDRTAQAVARHALSNVEYVLGTDSNPRLPERSLDLVFIAYSYHEFSKPETTMAAVRKSLKPGGRVFILEFAKENRNAPASSLHKMTLDEIRREVEPLGFAVDQLLDFLPMQHGVAFTPRF